MLRVPNIPWEGAPVGPDESFNAVVRTEGEPPRFDFEPRDHVALVEMNDWADLSRITQVAGLAHVCAEGPAGLLEQALMFWAQQHHRRRRLHPDDRAGAGQAAGLRRHRPFPRPRGGGL